MYNRNSRASIVQHGNMNMNNHSSAHHHEDDNHEAENGQRDVDAMAAMAVFATCTWRRNRRRDPVPMHNSSLTGRMRVNEILNGHPQIIQGITSIEAGTFRALTDLLSSRALLSPTNNMTVDEQLFILLYICAQGATIQQTSYLFQHSKETTSRWFYAVLLAICSLKDEFIRPPDYTAVQPLIQEHGYKYRPWFDVRYPLIITDIIVWHYFNRKSDVCWRGC